MGNLSHIFGGQFPPPATAATPDPIEKQLAVAMQAAGIEPPDNIFADGTLHRFSTNGKRGDKSGWYVIYPDGDIPAGAFGDWRMALTSNFIADIGRTLTQAELDASKKAVEKAKKEREEKRKKAAEQAAKEAAQIYNNAAEASPQHHYIVSKRLKSAHNLRETGDGRLIVPIISHDGELTSLQYIDAAGKKLMHPDSEVKGCFYRIDGSGDTIYLCEGFATGASIHEATGATVYCAMFANNLAPVAAKLTGKVAVVADNDLTGVGKKQADAAAGVCGGTVIMPPDLGDANDYASAGNDLAALLNPKLESWLVQVDEFCADRTPVKWLVKGWIQQGGLAMIHGASGSGKTFVTLDICCRIAGGFDLWMGHKVTNGAVVYLAGEGHFGLRQRIAAWKQYNNAKNLNMWISKTAVDFNDPANLNQIVEYLKALPEPPKLVVIDTLHRFLAGDENLAKDAKTMIDACNYIQKLFGCAILLVHHTGVADEAQHRARGSSAWKGALDNEINIRKDKKTGSIIVSNPKQKDAEQQPDTFLDLQSVAIENWLDDDGEQVSSAVIVAGSEPAKATSIDIKVSKLVDIWNWEDNDLGQVFMPDGKPFIAEKTIKKWLIERDGKSEKSINSQLKPSHKTGFVGELFRHKILAGHFELMTEKGFAVIGSFLTEKDEGAQSVDNSEL